MSIGILGKKLGMSQLFDKDGNAVPVTLIEAGPCRVTQLKTQPLDGYTAIQIGYGVSKDKHCLLYTSPSPRDLSTSRMPSSA